MYTFALQGIQISRQKAGLSLTFTGPHLGNTTLMQYNTADQLYSVMLRLENSPRRLSYRGVCLRQNIIQRLTLCQPLLIFFCLIAQLLVRHLHHVRTHALNLIDQTLDALDFPLTMCTKYFLYYTHDCLVSVYRMSAACTSGTQLTFLCC